MMRKSLPVNGETRHGLQQVLCRIVSFFMFFSYYLLNVYVNFRMRVKIDRTENLAYLDHVDIFAN